MEFEAQLFIKEETSGVNVTVNARIRVLKTDLGYVAILV